MKTFSTEIRTGSHSSGFSPPCVRSWEGQTGTSAAHNITGLKRTHFCKQNSAPLSYRNTLGIHNFHDIKYAKHPGDTVAKRTHFGGVSKEGSLIRESRLRFGGHGNLPVGFLIPPCGIRNPTYLKLKCDSGVTPRCRSNRPSRLSISAPGRSVWQYACHG